LARAQSFDLTNGRVPVASLDGFWRFHIEIAEAARG
jgi:hypothetical protein